MQLIETVLARFGSRFTLHFLPHSGQIRLGPLGKYYDKAFELRLGYKVNGQFYSLPFSSERENHFPEVEMDFEMTALTFRARHRPTGIAAKFRFSAPFYPQDEKLSSAPFFYLDAMLESAPANAEIELVAELVSSEIQSESYQNGELSGQKLACTFEQIESHWGPHPGPDSLSAKKFTAPILLLQSSENKNAAKVGATSRFLLATWLAEPVLEIKQELYVFRYTEFFANVEEVCRYALSERAEIERKSNFFQSVFSGATWGKSQNDFLAFTLQSYLMNTWLAQPVQQRGLALSDPAVWFSVWEGNCTFHSTVDVEYNLAWFYFLLWPELLEKTLSQWRGYFQTDKRGTWLSHDIGGLLGANHQTYPHHMEVEENCNFILLAYALWHFTGKAAIVQDNAKAVATLINFVLDSDTTGNGFPNRGIANTVDDASPAVQFGKEQIYLAVKALAACQAATKLLTAAQTQPDLVQKCHARVSRILETLENEAWQGDHYAVTLDRTTDGLVNPWTGEALPPGQELPGWNAYTLYTANGLLLLLATTPTENLPALDFDRLRQDVQNSLEKSLIEYGCTHSSRDRSHIWVSQNLWRDFIGCYLGLDLTNLSDRYWAFEQFENGPQGRGGCFVDTYGGNHLRYYPRGITSLGVAWAAAGAKLDKPNGRLTFAPARVPLRLPLLPFADWENEQIAWADFSLVGGQVQLKIENNQLLQKAGIQSYGLEF